LKSLVQPKALLLYAATARWVQNRSATQLDLATAVSAEPAFLCSLCAEEL